MPRKHHGICKHAAGEARRCPCKGKLHGTRRRKKRKLRVPRFERAFYRAANRWLEARYGA